jgi:hypothetical protein
MSAEELTNAAKSTSFPLRELFLRELAKRDNHMFYRQRWSRRLKITDYALHYLP